MSTGAVLLYTFLGLLIFCGLEDIAHFNRVIHRDLERIARQLEKQNRGDDGQNGEDEEDRG